MVPRKALGPEVAHHSRDRIGHPVRKMHARVAESHSGIGGRKLHLLARLEIVGILHRPHEILRYPAQRFQRPDVADRIRTLVRGAQHGPFRPGTAVERQRRVRLDRVAEDVEPAGRRDLGWHRSGVLRIEDSEQRLQPAVGDAGLCVQRRVVEDRHPGGLAPRPGGGRHRDQRLERPGNRLAFADRRVDVVEKVRRIGRVEVRRLGGVDRRSASDRHEGVEVPFGREIDRVAEGHVGGLDVDAVEERAGDPVVAQALEHGRHRRELRQVRIGQDHHPLCVHLREVHADLARDARAEPDARGSELERVFEGHGSSSGRAQRAFAGRLPDAPPEPDDGKAHQREDDHETEPRQHRQHRESRG